MELSFKEIVKLAIVIWLLSFFVTLFVSVMIGQYYWHIILLLPTCYSLLAILVNPLIKFLYWFTQW